MIVTYYSKFSVMKKILVAVVLIAGLTVVAFASFNNNRKKAGTEKKLEKKQKECSHKCKFN